MLSSKNIFKTTLCSVLAAVFVPFFAHAAVQEVSNPLFLGTYLSNGGEYKLVNDITVTVGNLQTYEETVLDLNGFTLDLGENVLIATKKLTIKDSSGDNSGKITCSGDYCVQVGSSSVKGELVLESGTIETTEAYYTAVYNLGIFEMTGGVIRSFENCVRSEANNLDDVNTKFIMRDGLLQTTGDAIAVAFSGGPNSLFEMYGGKIDATSHSTDADGAAGVGIYADSTAHFYGGEVEAYSFPLYTNGSGSDRANITIDDGYFKMNYPNGPAVYIPHRYGLTTINGGTFEGPSAIEIRAGDLVINGGTFISTADHYEVRMNNSGSTTTGAAVAVAQHNTKEPINVTINGGSFEANMPISYTNPQNNSQEDLDKITIIVNGGDFASTSDDDTLVTAPDGIILKVITGGTFSHSVADYVANGYGEVPINDQGSVEVTRVHNISVMDESVDLITIDGNLTSAPYKTTVRYRVVDDPNLVELVEVIDGQGNISANYSGSFVMPDTDVMIRVRYVERVVRKVTFKIVNGTWEDGTTDNIVIEIIADENGITTLSPDDYPAGMIVNDGFTGGSWDHYTSGEFVEDLVITYSYVEEEIGIPDTGDPDQPGGDEGRDEGEGTSNGSENTDGQKEDDLTVPETGARSNEDVASRIGSISGVVVLFAGLIAIISGLVHVGKEIFIGEEEGVNNE
ncbi:hypothetical protein J6T21_02615 [Candidatus Saccharibacteria bacterium]|nr:hypothetical protein [Candidatus Saccharibacteria bacterium]